MVELQRGGQVEARSLSYHVLAVEMRLGEGRRKVHAGAGRTRGADGGDGNRFPVRGGANGHLVAHNETVHAAECGFAMSWPGCPMTASPGKPNSIRCAGLPESPSFLPSGTAAGNAWTTKQGLRPDKDCKVPPGNLRWAGLFWGWKRDRKTGRSLLPAHQVTLEIEVDDFQAQLPHRQHARLLPGPADPQESHSGQSTVNSPTPCGAGSPV